MSNSSAEFDRKLVGIDWRIARRLASIIGGFWRGSSMRLAWSFTLGLSFFLILRLFVDVGFNQWHRWFFDAIGNHDTMEAGRAVGVLLLLVLSTAAVGVGIVWTRETLQVRWREWCTGQLLDRWIGDQRFLRMTRVENGLANPEYRISDDVRLAIDPLTDFAIGIFTALLSASIFIVVLWQVGGSTTIPVAGVPITIPAFMVIGAVIYGVSVSCLVPAVGRRLGAATAARNESEALFRARTIQLRESAESIVLTRAEAHERGRLASIYSDLVGNWLAIVRQHCNVAWVINANSALIPTIPIVIALPKYMSGQFTLGEMMQLASAFVQVQLAINWVTDHYRQVAEWFASARRVVELVEGLDDLDQPDPQQSHLSRFVLHGGDAISMAALVLCDRSGRKIVECGHETFRSGERVMISAEIEADKSVLARAILGFWPWGSGYLTMPAGYETVIAHGSPYLPEGSLDQAVLCPMPLDNLKSEDIAFALSACGLSHLVSRLDQKARWMQVLSASEKQRCAIARILLQKPRVIVLEDALSACDADAQAELTRLVFKHCAASIIVDISNRPAPSNLYDRIFILKKAVGEPSKLRELNNADAWSHLRSSLKE